MVFNNRKVRLCIGLLIFCITCLLSLKLCSNANALTKDYNALSFMYNTPQNQTFVSTGLLSYNSPKFNMHAINQLATRIGSSSIPSNANYLSYTGKFNLLTWTDNGSSGYLPQDFGDLKIYSVKIDGVSYNFESANVQRFVTNFTCDPLDAGISTNCRTFTYQVSFVIKDIPTSMSNLVVEIIYDNNGTLNTGYSGGFNAYFEPDTNNYVSLDFAYDYTSALLQQQISQAEQNTQDMIDNQNQNTQDIINNQTDNTQDIIDNQNQNTQDIIRSNQNCRNSYNLFNGNLQVGLINGDTGQNLDRTGYVRSTDYIPVQALSYYTFSSDDYSGAWYIYEYTSNYTYNLSANKYSTNGTFQTDSGTSYIRFRTASFSNTNAKIMLVQGSSSKPYEAYGEEICKNVNQEYYDEQREADNNISNQSTSDIDGATNAQTTSLIGTIQNFVSALSSIQTGSCELTLPFPQFIGGDTVVNPCSGKEKAPTIISIGSSMLLIGVFVPLAFIVLKMIYNEIRSFTNG